RLGLDHLRFQVDRDALLLEARGQRPDQVGIGAGDQLPGELDHRHLAAEAAVHGRHLQADDAAADDQQLLRHLAELQRVGRIHDPRVIPREARQLQRLRTGGDDALLEAQQLHLAVVGADLEFVRRDEAALAGGDAHLALPGHAPSPLVSWPTTLSLYSRSLSSEILGLLNSTPNSLACAAWSITSAACSS